MKPVLKYQRMLVLQVWPEQEEEEGVHPPLMRITVVYICFVHVLIRMRQE
jgi:hypothetical protein